MASLTLGTKGSLGVRGILARVVVFFVFLAICLFVGLVSALGSLKLGALIAAALGGVFLLAVSAEYLVLGLVALSFFVIGQLFYFAGVGQAVWIAFGLGALLYVKWFALGWGKRGAKQLDGVSLSVAAFFLAFLLSILVSRPPALQALAGGKNLVFLWSVFFLAAGGFVPWAGLRRLWLVLEGALYFQVPIVIYQYFVVAPSRTRFGATAGGVEWDAVVGGFGGDPLGGGYSGGMAYFVCVMAAFALVAYRRALIGKLRLAAMLFSALLCVALAEVKVVVVLIPVAAFVYFLPQIRKRPAAFMLGVPAMMLVGFGVLWAYESLHYGHGGSRASSPEEIIDRAFGYSLDPNQINWNTGQLGRAAALAHWFNAAMLEEPAQGLFGYGPGASRGKSIVGAGEAAKRFPFSIDRSAAAQLLWDVGLLGFLCYTLAAVIAALRAITLAAKQTDPYDAAILEATAMALGMLTVMLPYSRDVLEAPAVAVLVMLLLGLVVQAGRRGARPSH